MAVNFCTVCNQPATGSEARELVIRAGRFSTDVPDRGLFSATDDEQAFACGQRDALVLSERYFERGTFAPAAHNLADPLVEAERQAADAYQALT